MAQECAVMQSMIEEVGVPQYNYMHSFGLLSKAKSVSTRPKIGLHHNNRNGYIYIWTPCIYKLYS